MSWYWILLIVLGTAIVTYIFTWILGYNVLLQQCIQLLANKLPDEWVITIIPTVYKDLTDKLAELKEGAEVDYTFPITIGLNENMMNHITKIGQDLNCLVTMDISEKDYLIIYKFEKLKDKNKKDE